MAPISAVDPPLLRHHLPSEVAAGRYPAGPLARRRIRYWHGPDGHLHGNRFCPRLAGAFPVELDVVLTQVNPLDFCRGCCDDLPEPGPPTYADLRRYVDLARALAGDRERIEDLLDRPERHPVAGHSGPWGRLAVLNAEYELASRRALGAPDPLDRWMTGVLARAEGLLAAARADGEAALHWAPGGTRTPDTAPAGEVPPETPAHPSRRTRPGGQAGPHAGPTAAQAGLLARDLLPRLDDAPFSDTLGVAVILATRPARSLTGLLGRRWAGLAERWRLAVVERLVPPAVAAAQIAAELPARRAGSWRARAWSWADSAWRSWEHGLSGEPPRVVASVLDATALHPAGPALMTQVMLARWTVARQPSGPGRLAVVPSPVAGWIRAVGSATWLVDLGPVLPQDSRSVLVGAGQVWNEDTGPAAALHLARSVEQALSGVDLPGHATHDPTG